MLAAEICALRTSLVLLQDPADLLFGSYCSLPCPSLPWAGLWSQLEEKSHVRSGGLAEATFAGHRLIIAHDPLRAAEQREVRRTRIAELEVMAEKMVGRLDAQDDGATPQGCRVSDRGVYSRFTRALAEMTRFLTADRFSWSVDEEAVAKAQLFDGTLALITNTVDISPAEAVARYKGLADIERGFRVLKSGIEIAPVHHRLPDRFRTHALICFLALTLYRVMRMRLKTKSHGASPKAALEILAKM